MKDTQRMQVLLHLIEYGEITSWCAIQEYHITRLSEYIRALRAEGKNIQSVWEEMNGKRYVRYILVKEDKK